MSSFRIWNSSAGIPSPPLALFVVMLHKAHLISHSRMSGSRLVLTPLWLSGSWKSFLNIFCFCYVHTISVLILPIFAWNVLLVSLVFLKRSLVFPILLFSSISLHWSLRKAFLSLLAIPWNPAFSWIYVSFSPLPLASLLSYSHGLLGQPFCPFVFLFLGDGFSWLWLISWTPYCKI